MLSNYERRILSELEVGLAVGESRRRARRATTIRGLRLWLALGCLGAAVWSASQSLLAAWAGALLVAVTAVVAGGFLCDASRQWRTRLRRVRVRRVRSSRSRARR